MPGYGPDLSAAQVQQLANETAFIPEVEYGTPLPWIAACAPYSREWLGEAVSAGWVPHFDGIAHAVAGAHLWFLGEIADCIASDVRGDAEGWAEVAAADYRELATTLERLADELEAAASR